MSTKTIDKKTKSKIDAPVDAPVFEQLAYSLVQTVKITSLSKSTILTEIREGALPSIRRRRRILILAKDLQIYLGINNS